MCQVRRISKPFDSAGKVPKFYLTKRRKEWLKTRMQYAIQSTFVFCPMPKSIEWTILWHRNFICWKKCPLCFSYPPTCRCLVKRISRSGTGALRDVPAPPPGVVHGTKLGDVLCLDFALLVVLGF